MCQAKPGPRCSDHARQRLDSARSVVAAAEAAYEDAREMSKRFTGTRSAYLGERCPTCDGPLSGHDESMREYCELRGASTQDRPVAQERVNAALRELADARIKCDAAKREWETTPDGQRSLQEAQARLEAEGDAEAAAAVAQRLEEARETRERQKADLAIREAQEARLAAATPQEQAYLDSFEQRAAVADAEVVLAEKELLAAEAEHRDTEAPARALREQQATALAHWRQVKDEARETQKQVAAEAKRLYVDAGVDPRYAAYYANDMLAAASGETTRGYGRPSTSQQTGAELKPKPMRMKVKRNGADKARTQAAAEAAATDDAFLAAKAEEDKALARQHEASAAYADLARQTGTAAQEALVRRQAAYSRLTMAQQQARSAQQIRQGLENERIEARARVAAGIGVQDAETIDWHDASSKIMRNPDGTVNAYVFQGPREGFPQGRYVRATGITNVMGMTPGNALVLESREKAFRSEHYARRGIRGASAQVGGVQKVLVVRPKPGATPLVLESPYPKNAWGSFIDSTD